MVQPNNPKDDIWLDNDCLRGAFCAKAALIHRLNRWKQKANQPVLQYAVKQRAANCDFGANLEASRRDWFVSGIRNEACQKRLLSVNDLIFAKVFEIILNIEMAL